MGNMVEILNWSKENVELIVLFAIVSALSFAVLYSYQSRRDGSGVYLPNKISGVPSNSDDLSDPAQVRRVFNNVFFDNRTRSSMIRYYKEKHGLKDDIDAMRLAIRDREKDERRWK